jgi:hypothetical protein
MDRSEKLFSRSTAACPLRRKGKTDGDRKYLDSLFNDDWEVFVIKRDNEKGTFDWFTQCCEAATAPGQAMRLG